MIQETTRQHMYQEIEEAFPLRRAGDERSKPGRLVASNVPLDLSMRRRQAFLDLNEQIVAQVLFQLHTLFELSADDDSVRNAVREALENIYGVEETCGKGGPCDAHKYALALFRKHWHTMSGAADTASLLSGVRHLEQAGFFNKAPLEIARWASRFLLIEHYHRLDERERETRSARYHFLRSRALSQIIPAIHHFEDLLIWLDFRLREGAAVNEEAEGRLSRELSRELEGMLSPGVLMGDPLQPALYVLLACRRHCLAETVDPCEEKRLRQLFATRQMDSLLDLMRVVIPGTTRTHRMEGAAEVLDRLQGEGFNIRHQGFRDPYEADLVSLSDTERMETTSLPLFVPLDGLTGELSRDLALSGKILLEWHSGIVKDIIEDCEAYASALLQPLPRAGLLRRLIRFATSWTLAKSSWPVPTLDEQFEETVRKLLPEDALRQLIRPRKGYEIKSRQELNQLIAAENQRQREALDRIATTCSIQGYHDYAQFTRYAAFRHLQECRGGEPGHDLKDAGRYMGETAGTEWIRSFGSKWSIEAHQAHPHSLESVQQCVRNNAPQDQIVQELERNFETSKGELRRTYEAVINRLTPVFHQLLVAYGRNRAGASRLRAPVDHIPEMVILLAPPLAALRAITSHRLKQDFISCGTALYRSRLRPYLLDRSEWEAHTAYQTKTYIEKRDPEGRFDIARFLEVGNLDGLLTHLEKAAGGVDLAPIGLSEETVLTTLLGIIASGGGDSSIPEARVQEVTRLLPQQDCAACGRPTCRELAVSLLLGRAEPRHCIQLPPERLPLLMEKIKVFGENRREPSPTLLDLLRYHRLWRGSPEKAPFQQVLSIRIQKARRLFLQSVKDVWDRLSPKPKIFKHPDFEEFHGYLHRYMGREAAERLRDEEIEYLIEHGELRKAAEWRLLKARQDWLTLADRDRKSGPLLKSQNAEWTARESYGNVFFLHRLGSQDRRLVLQYRLEKHQDGFSHWWNEDLLAMNHPDFTIRDWEDFSKIIKNAYWHQESSLPVEDATALLETETLFGRGSPSMLGGLLREWIDAEEARLAFERGEVRRFREGPERRELQHMSELRAAIRCLVDEMKIPGLGRSDNKPFASGLPLSSEDRMAVEMREVWRRFQEEDFLFSPAFFCSWDELLPAEREVLMKQSSSSGPLPSEASKPAIPSPDASPVPGDRSGSIDKREAFVRAVISSSLKSRHREAAEWECLKSVKDEPFLPLGSLKLLIRNRLRDRKTREQVETEIEQILASSPDAPMRLLRDALREVVLEHQYDRLRRFNDSFVPQGRMSEHWSFLLDALPGLEASLNTILDRHKTLDRERLLHYLYLLAKMEGNLDTLTALLREIRETSDVIEAAWLRFTQERIAEGPAPKSMPGISLGLPLLASRLKEKEPVNRGLMEGISRKEKKNVATAVAEILNIVRYFILLSTERQSDEQGIQQVMTSISNAGYDLSGIDEEAVERVVRKEWGRRDQFEDQRIWVFTTVIGRRLAAQHPDLEEAEREFYKLRLDILKEDTDGGGLHQGVASRRGVALGQIKEQLYLQLSDLLESDRITTFQNRIRQIVAQLDQKLEDIHRGWLEGEINDRTLFYLLRQHQKDDREPSWKDCERLIHDHWLIPIAELRASQRPDREERIRHLDDRFRAILGVSLRTMEADAAVEADLDFKEWIDRHLESME